MDSCPECGELLDFDEVDIGVGVQRGNYHCLNCGWCPPSLCRKCGQRITRRVTDKWRDGGGNMTCPVPGVADDDFDVITTGPVFHDPV
jgi:transcription elongation factor Elf1